MSDINDDTGTELPPVLERTEYLQLPLPHSNNRLELDVDRLRESLRLIDAASRSVDQLMGTKANQDDLQALDLAMTQEMAAAAQQQQLLLQQLQQQLQQQMQQQANTLNSKIDNKKIDLQTVLNSSTMAEFLWGVRRTAQLLQAHSNSASNGVPFDAAVEYSLYAAEVYSRPLPANPTLGDTIVLLDPWSLWSLGRFTLRRGNPAHVINGVYEDVLFNANARRVTLHYSWANYWTLSIG
ncbi:hypothetical protein [Delftia sp. WSY_22]|uniref:hypothetical protein n=1 Tax=Delftia sp. WSY_22 TaxID=3367213 RepID=UPI00370B129A